MRRSEAARYARWSAAIALSLAFLTAGVYLKRGWQRITDQKKAPPPAPVNVEKQSSGLTFSKMDGPRKIFTVEASKSIDFKGQNDSVLEQVKVTIFGKKGERHDTIQTQSCQYGKDREAIVCSGEVQIDLESAAEADRAVSNPIHPPQAVHVETRGVTFNRASGTAQTEEPVVFSFPNGKGQAVGADYNSDEGMLRLVKSVQLELKHSVKKGLIKNAAEKDQQDEIRVRGTSLEFGRDQKTLHIAGPTEAASSSAHLTSGELTLEMDDAFRARRLLATPGSLAQPPELTSKSSSGATTISADKLTALFAPQGWIERVDGAGNVRGALAGQDGEDEFHAGSASLEMWPKLNEAKEMNLNGGVLLRTKASSASGSRTLQAGALRMNFHAGRSGNSGKPLDAETLTAGSMEWTDPPAKANPVPARMKLQADRLLLAFNHEGHADQLHATGNVQVERNLAGHPLQTATAKAGIAKLVSPGGWSQMDLDGGVRLKEAGRNAEAQHAMFAKATQSVLLSGEAVARDAATETRAPRIYFTSANGDMHAEGGVRSTDFSPSGSAVHLAQAPVNLVADSMQGNSKTGHAVYSGHARLWQGESVLEADSIELLRAAKTLNASGNVRAVFPQISASQRNQTSSSGIQDVSAPSPAAKTPVLWHVSAGLLRYNEATDSAHLEKNVVVQSSDQRIRAPVMDLYFSRTAQSSAPASNATASAATGARQISRAVGTGGVIVDQAGRRATADRGEYTAADGKFVMTGGSPALYDGAAGVTTGRSLTFFLADDTIIVDSENGSRTLTKHRVEK